MAPLSKLYLTFLLSLLALISDNLSLLFTLYLLEILSGLYFIRNKSFIMVSCSIVIFSCILVFIQLICNSSLHLALASGAKMAIMATSLLLLLQTTTSRQLTITLVSQLHLPYSYAFMITAILRFVPELLAECKLILDTQACRGFKPSKNPLRRLYDYVAIVKPMIFKAITRSEDMALSLQLRGFSVNTTRTFLQATTLQRSDYFIISLSSLLSILLFMVR